MKKIIAISGILLFSIFSIYILVNLYQINSYEQRKEIWNNKLYNRYDDYDALIQLLLSSDLQVRMIELDGDIKVQFKDSDMHKVIMEKTDNLSEIEKQIIELSRNIKSDHINLILENGYGYTFIQYQNGHEMGMKYDVLRPHNIVSHIDKDWFFYDTSYDITKESKLCRIIYNLVTSISNNKISKD